MNVNEEMLPHHLKQALPVHRNYHIKRLWNNDSTIKGLIKISIDHLMSPNTHSHPSLPVTNSLPTSTKCNSPVFSVRTCNNIRLLRCSRVIVVRRYVLILLNAEKEHSDVACVAGIAMKSFITIYTTENSTISAEDLPPRIWMMSLIVISLMPSHRCYMRGSWASSWAFDKSFL